MKDLSIEEKAKAYDEAIERAKSELNSPDKRLIEYIFPELKESEDERIRKRLLELFENHHSNEWYGLDVKKVIAWLEKQEKDTYDYKRVNLDKFDERIQEFSDMLEDKPKPYWDGWYEAMDWIRVNGTPFVDEKQGEQKSLDDIVKEVTKDKDAAVSFLKSTGIINENGELADEYKIEQDEQKSQEEVDNLHNYLYGEQKPADKVEPKFRIEAGKWYICISQYCNCIEGRCYQALSDNRIIDDFGTKYNMHNDVDKYFRLWTIQDAKDGDVLFTSSTASYETFIFKNIDEKGNAKCYFAYDSEDGFREGKYHFIGRATDCKPATKEQRDTLMKAMADAGYTFDFEKKALKKIEQKPAMMSLDEAIEHCKEKSCGNSACALEHKQLEKWLTELKKLKEQKSAEWSDEDETMITDLSVIVHTYFSEISGIPFKYDLSEDKIRTWLKSLKDRVQPQSTWKPSEEQITELKHLLDGWSFNAIILESLYNDLKKLTE